MKIKELIEILNKFNPDSEVKNLMDDRKYRGIRSVECAYGDESLVIIKPNDNPMRTR